MNALQELAIMDFRILDSRGVQIQQGDLEALIATNRPNHSINKTAELKEL